jgi:ABC-2 type transport system permease protein
MNPRTSAVFRKELRDFRRNKFIVGTMIALPIFVIAIPFLSVLGIKPGDPENVVRNILGGASLSFFLVPLILPTVIAGYAVIGEREQGTLEPVLTTPVRESELLIGKALAAVVPCVSISYALYAIYRLVVVSAAAPVVNHLVNQPSQLLAVILFAPLLATFSIWVGLAISVRSNDVRVAQQLSGLAVLPMLGLIALFSFRVLTPSVAVALAGALLLAVFDLVAWRVVSALFDRERLLTRYGSV